MNVCHLLDETVGWEQRLGVTQLVERLPRERFACHVASISPSLPMAMGEVSCRVDVLPTWPRVVPFAAPAVARFIAQHQIRFVHAWGVRAGAAARAATNTPLIVELFDPLVARRQVRHLRSLARPRGFAVACGSEIVRRRLIEGGLPPELSVVIRPGVDFKSITGWRRGDTRKRLGLAPDEQMVILPAPVSRAGGQFEAFWALAVKNYLSGGLRVVVPGPSPEQRRIERFAATLPGRNPLIVPDGRVRFEHLLSIADTLLITPRNDYSTTSIAWAMAGGLSVIGTAVYAVAELIAHQVNGLLFKQVPRRSMTAALVRALDDRESQARCREVARGQAYEVFGMHRCVEQHIQLYNNVVSGAAAAEGIVDSAMTA